MDENEIFRSNLLKLLDERGFNEAQLSLKAGLNRRAVTDIRERRVVSPKLSTVFALAEALGQDPGEMIGLGPRPKLRPDLASYLAQYDQEAQGRILLALSALPLQPREEP